MSGILRRRACCCSHAETIGCEGLYGCSPIEYVGRVTDPYATARSVADGGPPVYRGGYNQSYLWAGGGWHFDGVEGSRKCIRVLVWGEAIISAPTGATYYSISGGSGPTVLRNPSVSDGFSFHPCYSATGTKVDGPYLIEKPAMWECLGVAGVPGGSFWPSMPTVTSIEAFLKGDEGIQGESPWWRTESHSFADGDRVDVAMIFTNLKRVVSKDPSTGHKTYGSESSGLSFLNGIRVTKSHANNPATWAGYPT